jgi:ABC-type multidrug transport system ATPase subunit
MSSLLSLIEFSLLKDGSPVDFQLQSGRAMAVMGPAASGKSFFIDCLMGRETPRLGFVRTSAALVEAGLPGGRRLRPQAIAQKGPGPDRAALAAEALIATGLWDARQTSLEKLSPSQHTACELLGPLAGRGPLLVIDGHLDTLDPWTLTSTWSLIRKRLNEGAGLVVVTNRAELASECDDLLVLRDLQVRYCGSIEGILSDEPSEISIETFRSEVVQSLAEPLALSIAKTERGLEARAAQGQDLAAQLLLAGYGDIRATVLRAPTLEQALARL